MDGNRRWAAQQGYVQVGRDGIDAAYRTADFCIKKNIRYLSLFAFSLENFKRSPQEVTHLFNLMLTETQKQKDELIKRGIKVVFVGDRTQFPATIKRECDFLENITSDCTVLHANIMICYGAQQEIIDAVKRITRDVVHNVIQIDDITSDVYARYLWTHPVPFPDLIIRTGGIQRLSNFLLYQSSYAELYFLDCLWPAMNDMELQKAVDYFEQCKRNFGR
jgi:undecaprenyl diphosphate synthase